MKKFRVTLLQWHWLAILMTGILSSCMDNAVDPSFTVNFPEDGQPFAKLSQYSLFEEPMHKLRPVEGVLSYELNTPLFSDYAGKARFIYLSGGTMQYEPKEVLNFPDGTILVKNFFYGTETNRRLIETRLLIKYSEGWKGLPYVWNKEQTEAFLTLGGAEVSVEDPQKPGEHFNYLVPNQNQCKGCHSVNNRFSPIGPKAGNLNRLVQNGNHTVNQLDDWISRDLLKGLGASDDANRYAVWDDPTSGTLDDRARAYLDVNCGHCHRPEGPANNSGMNLYMQEQRTSKLGFCKLPVSAGQGSGGFPYDIVPGDPDNSIMIYRMTSTNPRAKMPEIGRQLIHKEGVELIREWIASLDDEACE